MGYFIVVNYDNPLLEYTIQFVHFSKNTQSFGKRLAWKPCSSCVNRESHKLLLFIDSCSIDLSDPVWIIKSGECVLVTRVGDGTEACITKYKQEK